MNAICIKCWNPEAVVKLHLNGTSDLECGECGETFTCAETREAVDELHERWTAILDWVAEFPAAEPKPA